MKKIIHSAIICSILFCTFFSCSRSENIVSANKDELFTLNYGNFEDELNLFNIAYPGSINTHIAMRDGFFYIANGEAKKVIELNSYGNLLSLYYNPDAMRNLEFADENSGNSTKKAVSYPFNELGKIAVDSKKTLYIVDSLPEERIERDSDGITLLRNVVLRFDASGKFLDYIGQQGPGGTPFCMVKNIYTTSNNELVVVCSKNGGFEVFWFGSNGFLLYQIPISEKAVPKFVSEDEVESVTHFVIENVVPDFNNYKLYLKVDYYKAAIDPDLMVQSGIDFSKTILYPLDVNSGKYEEGLDIPAYELSSAEGMGRDVHEVPFEFLGVTENSWFFFMVPTDDGYLVQMVQPDGQRIVKRNLAVDWSRVLYNSVSLSSQGIISVLFIGKENAEVSWWRTDSIIDSLIAD